MDATQLIYDLYGRRPEAEFDLSILRRAGLPFGISEGAIRTALTRLKKGNRIEARARGRYAVIGVTAPMLDRLRGWREVLDRRRPWSGGWVLAMTGPATSFDRTTWRRVLRAFSLEGFRKVTSDVFARPENLRDGTFGARQRLRELGVPTAVVVGTLIEVDLETTQEWSQEWPKGQDRVNAELAERLLRSQAKLGGSSDADAAAEVLLLGRQAVRTILENPLLPEAWEPVDGLQALVTAMSEYDTFGKQVWATYLAAP